MENASKALMIAGAVLLAILILTIGVYLVGNFEKATDSYVSQLQATELNKYNSNFEVFIDRKDITAQELVTLISFTQEQERGTTVWLKQRSMEIEISAYDDHQKNQFLSDNILVHSIDSSTNKEIEKNLYEFVSIGYNTEGQVTEIRFKEKT